MKPTRLGSASARYHEGDRIGLTLGNDWNESVVTALCCCRTPYDRLQHATICQYVASNLLDTAVRLVFAQPEQRVTHRADRRNLLTGWGEPPEIVPDRLDRVVDSVAGTRIVDALGAILKRLLDGLDRTE